MADGNGEQRGKICRGGGSSGQGGAAAVHGGIQAEGFTRGRSVQAAGRDRGAVAAGGFVLVESDHVAQAAPERRVGGAKGEEKRSEAAGEKNPLANRVTELERENARLKRRAERAEGIVELQKKVSEILGIDLQKSAESD